jgi:hypothetical protein
MLNVFTNTLVYLENMKKMAAIVIELEKTSKVERYFKSSGISPMDWLDAKVLWFSTKLYSLEEIYEIHKSKDWNRVSKKKSRQPFKKVRVAHSGLTARNNKIEANLAREAEIKRLSANKSGIITPTEVKSNHRVYALKLHPEVLKSKRFLERNKQLSKRPTTLVYIGETSKTREERHRQHCFAPEDGSRDLKSPIVRRFGERDFVKANLTDMLLNDLRFPVENLTKGEALRAEQHYGEHLKSRSVGTWYN